MDTKTAVERVTANSRKRRPNDSAHQQKRDKDGNERNADGEDGETDFFRALQRRGKGLHAVFQMARDIFHHHDGIIDHKSRGNGHGHQREVVQGVSEQIHHGERTDQRDRHRDRGNERGAAVAQEDKHHDDDEADGNQQRPLHVTDRGADGGGAIQNDGGIDAERNGCLDNRKLRADAIDRVNDIGAGLAEDDDRNRALAVQITGSTDVLHRVRHLGYVGKADRRAVLITDDEWLVVVRVRDLVVGKDVRASHCHRRFGLWPGRSSAGSARTANSQG